MAVTISRAMVNQYKSSVTGGSIPDGLYMRSVDDFIEQVTRSDTPMADLIRSKGTKKGIDWEFGESDLAPRTDSITTALADGTGTAVEAANGVRYQLWDLIKIEDEIMLVTGISSNNLTVVRGWGSTSGAAHADNSVVKILGPAVPEGVDAPRSPVVYGETFITHPQIMEYTWQVTNRGRHTPNYESRTDQFKYQLKKKMLEAAEDLDSLLLDGVKNAGSMTGTNPSSMGGLREFTTANVSDLSGDPLELVDILNLAQQASQVVGRDKLGKTVMGNHFVKRVWNSWFQTSRRSNQSDSRFKVTWDEVDTDFGVLKFVLNYKMDNDELFLWNPKDAGLYNFVNGKWSTGLYTTQGWYDTGFLRGDYGAIFQLDDARARWHSFSTTEADYPYLDLPAVYAIPTAA